MLYCSDQISAALLHLVLDTSGFPHLHVFLCPDNPPPASVTCPTLLMHPDICTHVTMVCLYASTHHGTRCSHTSAWHSHTRRSPLWSRSDSHHAFTWSNTHATLWDACHVCTCMRPNRVLPAVCWILRDEIHCVVMSHSTSYCCPTRSNCKFHFNSTHPNMLAYLLSPISQNHLSISACCSLCLCSI